MNERFFSENPETTSTKKRLTERVETLRSKHENLVKHIWKMDLNVLQYDEQEKGMWKDLRITLSHAIKQIDEKINKLNERLSQSPLDSSGHSSKSSGSFKA